MGACYSTHTRRVDASLSQLSTTRPAIMKKNGSQYSFGFRKPYSAARNTVTWNQNTADKIVPTVSEDTCGSSHLSQQVQSDIGVSTRFGFSTQEVSNSNVTSSNTSIDSLNTTHLKKICQAPPLGGTKRSISFEPDDLHGPFPMIDEDLSSQTNGVNKSKTMEYCTDSMQARTQSTDSVLTRRKLISEDLQNANIIPVRSPRQTTRNNVKRKEEKQVDNDVNDGRSLSETSGKKATSKARRFTDKLKQPFQRFSNGDTRTQKPTRKEKILKSEQLETSKKDKNDNKKDASAVCASSVQTRTSAMCAVKPSAPTNNTDDIVGPRLTNSKDGETYYELERKATAPIAMIDSLETTSIGSLNSEDLMLETDLCLDDYTEGYGDPFTGRIICRRSSSRRQHSLSGEKHDSKSHSVSDEKRLGPEGATPNRPTSLKIEHCATVDPQMEPLQELVALLRDNQTVRR